MLIENPSSGKTAKVPISETGTASSGISVARQPCRKMKTTIMTRTSASQRVLTISLMPSRTAWVVSSGMLVIEVGGEALLDLLHEPLDPVGGLDRVGAGQLVERENGGRLAVEAAGDVVGLGAQLDARHVLQPHDRAVRVGAQDDVAEFFRAPRAGPGRGPCR